MKRSRADGLVAAGAAAEAESHAERPECTSFRANFFLDGNPCVWLS